MKLVSFWFVFLIVNVLFYDFISNEEKNWVKGWEVVGLIFFEIIMIFILFGKVF